METNNEKNKDVIENENNNEDNLVENEENKNENTQNQNTTKKKKRKRKNFKNNFGFLLKCILFSILATLLVIFILNKYILPDNIKVTTIFDKDASTIGEVIDAIEEETNKINDTKKNNNKKKNNLETEDNQLDISNNEKKEKNIDTNRDKEKEEVLEVTKEEKEETKKQENKDTYKETSKKEETNPTINPDTIKETSIVNGDKKNDDFKNKENKIFVGNKKDKELSILSIDENGIPDAIKIGNEEITLYDRLLVELPTGITLVQATGYNQDYEEIDLEIHFDKKNNKIELKHYAEDVYFME